jgi:hypothetical protein
MASPSPNKGEDHPSIHPSITQSGAASLFLHLLVYGSMVCTAPSIHPIPSIPPQEEPGKCIYLSLSLPTRKGAFLLAGAMAWHDMACSLGECREKKRAEREIIKEELAPDV